MSWNETLDGIAVIGMAGRFPGAAGVGELWHNLTHGREGIATFEEEALRRAGVPAELLARPEYVRAAGILAEVETFDADFFGFSPREATILDPQHRLFLETAWHALEDAACDSERFDGRVGVFAGAGLNAYFLLHVHPNQELLEAVGAYSAVLATDEDFLTTRASYKLDLTGPSISVQTACSSSLVAVSLACSSLMQGECDAALAGGVTVRLPHTAGYLFQSEGILSPDGRCRPFDAAARGTVPASGVGLVVLKRLADAVADGDPVRAVLRGWAVNNDGGRKAGYTAPRAEGQEAAILEALALADFDPATMGFVEGHGTATPVGDPIEVAALTRAFRAHTAARGFCALGSLKGNLGHLDGAAGVAGLIKATLAVERGTIPGTLHFERPNPALELPASPFVVHGERRSWPRADGMPRRAGVSSFGIGGTNAHVVLEEAPPRPRAGATAAAPELLVLSARSAAALPIQGEALAVHLRALGNPVEEAGDETATVAEVAHTLRTGRRQLPHRRAVVLPPGADLGAGAEHLEAPGRSITGHLDPTAEGGGPRVAFLFPGQGVQYPGMSAGLYRRYPVFRAALDRCVESLRPLLEVDLRQSLFPDPGAEEEAAAQLRRTALTQPVLFAVGYAATELWRAWGVVPEVMLGHSVGEYLAAHLAGVFTLDDALALVAERGRLVDSLPPGEMLSVGLDEGAVAEWLERHPEVSLAAVNSPHSCTVGGPPEAVEALAARLGEQQVPHRRLHVERAFHSPALDPLLPAFAERVARVPRQPPRLAFLSCVTGGWVSAFEATDPAYWARQLRQPVRFADAAATLFGDQAGGAREQILLEVGPGEALIPLLRQHPGVPPGAGLVAAGRHPHDPRDDGEVLLEAAGRLWVAGVPVKIEALSADPGESMPPPRRVPLPLYPFQRQRYWVEATTPVGVPRTGKRADRSSWFYAPLWTQIPGPGVATSAPRKEAESEAGDRRWLVVAPPDNALAEDLTRLLVAEQTPLPTGREAAKQLLEGLRQAPGLPTDVVYISPSQVDGDDADLIAPFLHLVHTLAHNATPEPVTVTVILEGILGFLGGEYTLSGSGALAGLAVTIPQEYAHLRCRVVDRSAEPWMDPALLVAELLDAEGPPVVARYGAYRWTRRYQPLPLESLAGLPEKPPDESPEKSTQESKSVFQRGGHYLITGALGRFGLAVAQHLAEHYEARLTLLDQSDPADLAACTPEVRRRVQALLTSRSRAHFLRADVADEEAIAAAVKAGRLYFGRSFDGVLHGAALSLESGALYATVAETDPEFCRTHLRPKLQGLVNLNEALVNDAEIEPGEFSPAKLPKVALIPTSLAPILGGIGLAAYAAVDAAVDAFVESAGDLVPWRSINFEGWVDPIEGVGSPGGGPTMGQAQSALTLTEEELLDTLERAAAALYGPPGGPRRLVVATGDLEARLAQWSHPEQGGGTGSAPRGEQQAPYRAPRTPTEETVATIWQDVLGVEAVGLDDDFFMLGGSSLVGLQVISRLRAALAVELPLRSFFEARTVEALAAGIDAEKAQGDAEAERMAELLAEIEGMDAAEVAQLLGEETS